MKMLLCDGISTFEEFINKKRLIKKDKSDWVILTTDYLLYTKAEELHFNVKFLDSNEPIKIYDTTQLLKKINKEVFVGVGKSYLAEFNYHIEGAGIETDIADLLYNYEYCQKLFESYNLEHIYLFCNKSTYLECEIIKEIAKGKNVYISVYYGINVYQSLKNKLLFSNTFFNKGFKYLCYLFKIIVKFAQSLVISMVNGVCNRREHAEYELGVIWESHAIKHINWCKEKIETYNSHLKTNIICKFTKQSYMIWKRQEISTTLFDYSYLQLKDCIIAIMEYFTELKKILIAVNNFQLDSEYEYLDKSIKHRILQQALINVPDRFIVDAIAKNFYKWNQYQCIETWLGSNDIYSRIAYYNTRKRGTIFFRVLTGENMIMKNPCYEEVDKEMLSWCFFIGKTNRLKEFYEKSGWKGEAISLSGKGWNFEEYSKESDDEFSVLWAPSYPLKGYLSEIIFNKINDRILKVLESWDIKLYVKYHPNYPQVSVDNIMNEYKSNTIFFERKEQGIENIIKKVDLVVTTNSSIVVDSIKAATPVVVIREGDLMEMEEIFEASKAIFWDTNEAIKYIKRLLYDKDELKVLLKEENDKMMKICGGKNKENCYIDIVDKIRCNQLI